MLQYTYRSERTCYAKEKFFTYFSISNRSFGD